MIYVAISNFSSVLNALNLRHSQDYLKKYVDYYLATSTIFECNFDMNILIISFITTNRLKPIATQIRHAWYHIYCSYCIHE